MSSIDLPAPARHIRLTSHHPHESAAGAPRIHWGTADPLVRGPVVGTTTDRSRRNVIGTHSGSYGVYRALAVGNILGVVTEIELRDIAVQMLLGAHEYVADRRNRPLRAVVRRRPHRLARPVGWCRR